MLLSDFNETAKSIETLKKRTLDSDVEDLDEQFKFSHSYETPKRIAMLLSPDASCHLSLSNFLDSLLNCYCSDTRDNIFAFKHLFEPTLQRRIEVSYSQPVEEVILQAFMAMFETKSLVCIFFSSELDRQECPIIGRNICPHGAHLSVCSTRFWFLLKMTGIAKHDMPIFFTGGGRLLHTKGAILGKVFRVQRSSSPGIFKKFEYSKDYRKAKHKITGYYLFIVRGSSKQRNRRKASIDIALRSHKQRNRRTTSFDQIPPQLIRLCNDWCPASSNSLADGPDPELARQYQELAYFTFARTLCSFTWEESLLNKNANLPHKGKALDYSLSPDMARRGDVICALGGCETPVLLRSAGQHYKVLGEVSILCDIDNCQVLSQCNVLGDFILC